MHIRNYYFTVTAVIVVLTLLLVIALTAILVYIFYYKPKKEAEMAEQTALYSKNSGIVGFSAHYYVTHM